MQRAHSVTTVTITRNNRINATDPNVGVIFVAKDRSWFGLTIKFKLSKFYCADFCLLVSIFKSRVLFSLFAQPFGQVAKNLFVCSSCCAIIEKLNWIECFLCWRLSHFRSEFTTCTVFFAWVNSSSKVMDFKNRHSQNPVVWFLVTYQLLLKLEWIWWTAVIKTDLNVYIGEGKYCVVWSHWFPCGESLTFLSPATEDELELFIIVTIVIIVFIVIIFIIVPSNGGWTRAGREREEEKQRWQAGPLSQVGSSWFIFDLYTLYTYPK